MVREYKDSGIEWIGQIPKEWVPARFKYSGSFIKGKLPATQNNENKGLPVIGASEMLGKEPRLYTEDFNIPTCSEEDILILWDGANAGIIANNCKGIVSSTAVKYSCTDKRFNKQYMFYLLKNAEPFFKSKVGGTTIPHMNARYIDEYLCILPPLSEQQKIADYLDKVCGEVDEMVTLQETMIEELKAYKQSVITEAVTKGLNPNVPMRDSGIDWIGEIPEHWELGRLKHVCKINGRIGFRGYTSEDLVSEGEGAYTSGGKHISRNVIDLSNPDYLSWDKYYESPEIMVKKGDMVMAQRGTLGRVALIREEIGPATINPSLVLLNNISNNAIYLYWWLCSSSISVKIDLLNTSTAVPMISQKQIENLELLLPPLAEQRAIAAYLDTKCSEIDALIALKQAKIEELKEYKKSVIYEYVTGKKEVE